MHGMSRNKKVIVRRILGGIMFALHYLTVIAGHYGILIYDRETIGVIHVLCSTIVM